ncbi:hypothetical protein D3C77_463660 [compost metagenome]
MLLGVHVVIGRHGQQLILGHRILYENNVHLSDWIAIADNSPTAQVFKHPSALYFEGRQSKAPRRTGQQK